MSVFWEKCSLSVTFFPRPNYLTTISRSAKSQSRYSAYELIGFSQRTAKTCDNYRTPGVFQIIATLIGRVTKEKGPGEKSPSPG